MGGDRILSHATCDELDRRVYRRMYPRLRPLHEETRRITAYPEAP